VRPPLPHVVRRFFGVLRARRLSPREQGEASGWLRPEERSLFWGQPAADQRHGLDCARAMLAHLPGRADLVRAALLHDVGKRHSALGAIGRSLATTLQVLRLPTWGRLAAYLDHGPRGADDLEGTGAEAVVVAYARHHHGGRPQGFPAGDWEALCRVDHA